MSKANKTFNLNVKDIEMIEEAIRSYDTISYSKRTELLAKLYHQKNWYQKTRDGSPYVSG